MALMQVGELEINVRQWGQGEAVFLVHGLGASSHLWINQIRVLAAHYRVVAIDLRGFGRSSKPRARAAYSIDLMADDVIGVCRALELRRIHYLGVSMGGFIGQAVALKAPQLCQSLILGQTAAEFGIPAEVLASRLAALDQTSMDEYAALVASQALAQPPDPIVDEWLRELIANNDREAYKYVLAGALAEFNLINKVGAIDCPTLVITGDDDRVIPATKGLALSQMIPGAHYANIARAGHISYAEEPAEFNRIVMEFLAGQRRPPAG